VTENFTFPKKRGAPDERGRVGSMSEVGGNYHPMCGKRGGKRYIGRLCHPWNYVYAARFTFAHLARCAAAILRRAEADMVRLPGFGLFSIETTFCARTLAQRSL